jgi:hypothetical protein
MFDRCLHVPALLTVKANRTPAGTLYTGIRLTGEGQRRVLLLRDYVVHHVTKHLQQGIESDHFRLKKNMPRVGGFQSFNTARRSIQGFAAMLWMRKGFGFAGAWTVPPQRPGAPAWRTGVGQLVKVCHGAQEGPQEAGVVVRHLSVGSRP